MHIDNPIILKKMIVWRFLEHSLLLLMFIHFMLAHLISNEFKDVLNKNDPPCFSITL